MAQIILDTQDPTTESTFRRYIEERDRIRAYMGRTVYPALLQALDMYNQFDQKLQPGEEFENLASYYTEQSAPVTPYIDQIRAAMQNIIDIMLAIEQASPGLFNITPPPPPPPPSEG